MAVYDFNLGPGPNAFGRGDRLLHLLVGKAPLTGG
jgi:hypothetical protein